MSTLENEILIERAYQLADELVSDPAGRDDKIYELIKQNDLDNLREFIVKVEGQLSQEHFHNYDILESIDED